MSGSDSGSLSDSPSGATSLKVECYGSISSLPQAVTLFTQVVTLLGGKLVASHVYTSFQDGDMKIKLSLELSHSESNKIPNLAKVVNALVPFTKFSDARICNA